MGKFFASYCDLVVYNFEWLKEHWLGTAALTIALWGVFTLITLIRCGMITIPNPFKAIGQKEA